jgi:protein-S-isoprenylcysteine O-methyltransferase Ste14
MDVMARALVASLFVMLSLNLWNDFVQTQRVTGLLLLVSEALVVVLTIVRRRTEVVDRTAAAAVVTIASVVGPALLRTVPNQALVPDALTALVSVIGLLAVIAGKVTLGRSFGIAPANRGVVVRGPYGFVRHPIYAGYLVTHVAFACAYPTIWNLAVLAVTDLALVLRALCEERVLSRDWSYQRYCSRVSWHLVPGLF